MGSTFVFAAAVAGFLHETTLLIPLSILTFNYLLTRILAGYKRGRACIPAMTWILGFGTLALSAGGSLNMRWIFSAFGEHMAKIGGTLDGMKGELSWYACFNLLMLRMISWSTDFYRSSLDDFGKKDVHETPEPAVDDDRLRMETHRSLEEYRSFPLYFAYLFYPPLYITGPTITFNAFASYMASPQNDCVGLSLVVYWARWVADAFCIVAFGHYLYTSTLNINGPVAVENGEFASTQFEYIFHHGQRGEALVWFSHWSLKYLWFKFLVMWRFARAWALSDGVSPPENMNRCMSNNYTVRGFWRAWHRSFNRWLVRYVFVPLGGSRGVSMLRRVLTIGAVFTIVAIWHEPPQILQELRNPQPCVPISLMKYPFLVGKQYEVHDSNGVFPNVTITKRNQDGTYGIRVDDTSQKTVSRVEPKNIRHKVGANGELLNFVDVDPYWMQCARELMRSSRTLQLLVWGWLFVLFMLPEVFVESLAKKPSIRKWMDARPVLVRHLTCLGGSFCILLLMLANLIGYSFGLKGGKFLVEACSSWNMILFMCAYTTWLAANVQIMLIIRQREAKSAIKLKGT